MRQSIDIPRRHPETARHDVTTYTSTIRVKVTDAEYRAACTAATARGQHVMDFCAEAIAEKCATPAR